MICLTSYIAIRMSMMRSEEVKNGAPISKLEKSIVNISLLPTCNSVLQRESDSSYPLLLLWIKSPLITPIAMSMSQRTQQGLRISLLPFYQTLSRRSYTLKQCAFEKDPQLVGILETNKWQFNRFHHPRWIRRSSWRRRFDSIVHHPTTRTSLSISQ